MKKADIQSHLIVRAKNADNFNYQIQTDKHKIVYSHARVTSVKVQYSSMLKRNETWIYYIPFNRLESFGAFSNGLVSCCKLNEFKREFKQILKLKP